MVKKTKGYKHFCHVLSVVTDDSLRDTIEVHAAFK